MNDDVRIVELKPMRVASVLGFGPQPEEAAWAKLEAWAGPRGLMQPAGEHRIFGFNNPSPTPGSPNYGYEFWIQVGPEVQSDEQVEVKDFPGGLYAVLRWDGEDDPYVGIPAAWKRLVQWRENSRYQGGGHQWLEESLRPAEMPPGKFMLDLYLPIH